MRERRLGACDLDHTQPVEQRRSYLFADRCGIPVDINRGCCSSYGHHVKLGGLGIVQFLTYGDWALRVTVPGGLISSAYLRAIASLADTVCMEVRS